MLFNPKWLWKLLLTPYMATFAVLVSVTSTLSVQLEGWAIPRSNYLRSHYRQPRHTCMYVHWGNLLQCQYLWMDSTFNWLHRWPHASVLQTDNIAILLQMTTCLTVANDHMPQCCKWPHWLHSLTKHRMGFAALQRTAVTHDIMGVEIFIACSLTTTYTKSN